jgi:hypothetical protein
MHDEMTQDAIMTAMAHGSDAATDAQQEASHGQA